MADNQDIDITQFQPAPSGGGRGLSPRERKLALETAQQAERQRHNQFQENMGMQQFDQQERHFQVREQREAQQGAGRLALDQQANLLKHLDSVMKLMETRTNLEESYQKRVASVGALDYFSKLKTFDPKVDKSEAEGMQRFHQQFSEGLVQFADGLDHPAVTKLIERKQGEFDRFQQAVQNRDSTTFTGAAAKEHDRVLAATGDPVLAQNMAKAKAAQLNDINGMVAAGHLTPAELSKFFTKQANPDGSQSEGFDFDAAHSVAAARKGAQVSDEDQFKVLRENLDAINRTLVTVGGRDPKSGVELHLSGVDPKARAKMIEDLQGMVGKMATDLDTLYQSKKGGAASTAAAPAKASPLDDLLPKGTPKPAQAPAQNAPATNAPAPAQPKPKLDIHNPEHQAAMRKTLADAGGDKVKGEALLRQSFDF